MPFQCQSNEHHSFVLNLENTVVALKQRKMLVQATSRRNQNLECTITGKRCHKNSDYKSMGPPERPHPPTFGSIVPNEPFYLEGGDGVP